MRDRGKTVCIVEHSLHVVERLADTAFFMELGRITARGTIGELTSNPRLTEVYFGTVLKAQAACGSVEAVPLLSVAGVDAGYGKKRVLDDVDLAVGPGEAIALLGHNGAGKTTLLQAVFGLQPIWKGQHVVRRTAAGRAHSPARSGRAGMAMIPAERFVFPDLTVLENLRLGVRGSERRRRRAAGFDSAYEDLPDFARARRSTGRRHERRRAAHGQSVPWR